MHVFVTGATGWVGGEVVKDLIGAGYRVTGLARSDEKAQALAATGAKVLRGCLDDLDVLAVRPGAQMRSSIPGSIMTSHGSSKTAHRTVA